MSEQPAFRAGIVAVLGKPNVGKSTLINAIVGQKVSIVSNKPQTTRKRVVGIANPEGAQIVFVDTPGIHEPHNRLGRAMVEQARGALNEVDLILFVGDASHHPGEQDQRIAELIAAYRREHPTRALLCLNKMDQLKPSDVERNVDAFMALVPEADYMLTTATQGHNLDKLIELIVAQLPEGEALYNEDEFTDQSSRFLVAELIREQVLRGTRQEVPHSTAVLVDTWEDEGRLLRIGATVLVERASQRGILIGRGGQFLKRIGSAAREEVEKILDRKVHLEIHIKVAEDWRQNPRVLHELEYDA